jgi:hypothetical protein
MSNEEPKTPLLSDEELEKVVGGEAASFNFTKLQVTYAAQKEDGSAPPPAK